MQSFFLYAKEYFNFGFNVTCLSNYLTEHNFVDRNTLKAPYHRWKDLLDRRQSFEEIENFDWSSAIGIGAITGIDNLRVIDIDGCTDDTFLRQALEILNLPSDYEWVVESGSYCGYHIYAYFNKYSRLKENEVVSSYPPKDEVAHKLEKIEILWNTHVVLPPSLHISSNRYSFKNCVFPKSKPQKIDLTALNKFIDQNLKASKISIGTTYKENIVEMKPEKAPNDLEEEILDNKDNLSIVFDVETNDFIRTGSDNQNIYPEILQIAWVVIDNEGMIYKKQSHLIYENQTIENKAFEINGIDTHSLRVLGKKYKEVFNLFIEDLRKCETIVVHNSDFDIPILSHHLNKENIYINLESKNIICTMKGSAEFCQIPEIHGNGFKYPTLEELYYKLFDLELNQQHNAISDSLVTAKCFIELKKMDKLSENGNKKRVGDFDADDDLPF